MEALLVKTAFHLTSMQGLCEEIIATFKLPTKTLDIIFGIYYLDVYLDNGEHQLLLRKSYDQCRVTHAVTLLPSAFGYRLSAPLEVGQSFPDSRWLIAESQFYARSCVTRH
jgi:hypothetical protein